MMGVAETLVFVVLVVPVSVGLALLALLSAIGRTLAFRTKSVQALLYVFEYGRKKIEKANEEKYGSYDRTTDEDEVKEVGHEDGDANGNKKEDPPQTTTYRRRTPSVQQPPPSEDESGEDEEVQEVLEVTTHDLPSQFQLSDIFEFTQSGIEAIVEDQVTQRFVAEELKSWNLLTRTNRHYEFISWRLSFIWVTGFFIRYFILLPFRVTICFLAVLFLTASTAMVGCIPTLNRSLKQRLYKVVYLQAFQFLSWSLSAVIHHHGFRNRPGVASRSVEGIQIKRGGGICVANHTSPIDVLVLAVDQCYDMVGQQHGGFLGLLQRALARASNHIWFERSETKDREAVAKRLKEHVEDASKLPILIFPEGTCINNSAVMQFKKGSFEVGGVIYPVAIKYDARFGDPFWDSSNYSMVQYLLMMMSSWAIVCDVWYLPPMIRRRGETAVDFANRVKGEIARKGGLVDLDWDGQLKRSPAKKEWKEQQQLEYSKKFATTAPSSPSRVLLDSTTSTRNENPNPST